ncbi:phosphomannomutase [Barrientosiimonas humi]|uniref:Phosphomannomutase n=1 Tax=Barrientosiimonas humi TaxID=999931 RepID=A0A542XDT7_9MICO|nr:phospho-sugar mutase [Barrientosiimonas humi]TQL34002.1 phosphomannomutase [Barrientosiimonas humi]CAG7573992.1 putative phosphomannomutase [Barrientosiimonas humi]
MSAQPEPDLAPTVAAARAWLADDPDPATRAELAAVLAAVETGDAAAAADLADRFSGLLEFGTAGLRGALGAGPNRMNRVVVRRAAAGLTAFLQEWLGRRDVTVVVGFDARHGSDAFARDTAGVVEAAGGRAMVLPRALPTPVLAFAVRYLGCDAGVMVTASHNPPQDNGYKVYLGDGSQIVPPADAQISAAIDRFPTAASVAIVDDGWETLGDDLVEAYVDAAARVVPDTAPREVSIVHTALHGVGDEVLRMAFAAAGFADPAGVASQRRPDPEFPTVSFPNPEEPGAIDAALELARELSPDVVIANDPDADRCAVAVDDPVAGRWRMLRGDEVGALLGAEALAHRHGEPDAVVACSIVSSQLLGAMARAAGVRHEETLTGFKWISRVPGLIYGYEEALGYCVDPGTVKDKDGITAALVVAAMTARLHAQGRTLLDVLDDLAREHGVHATDSFSVRVADLSLIPELMTRLRTQMPDTVAGQPISRTDDLSRGDGGLPPTEGLRWFLADGTRIIARPSGTEPKLKVYLEAVVPLADDDLAQARGSAARRLADVRAAMEQLTAI